MTATFVDTSFLLAVTRTNDQHHRAALTWKRNLRGPFLTTDFVLLEFMDASSPPALRLRGLKSLRVIREDREVTIVRVSPQLFDDGVTFFKKHADKEWSLTDCISFVVMQEEGIEDALTSDHHFVQAGFRALLRFSPPKV